MQQLVESLEPRRRLAPPVLAKNRVEVIYATNGLSFAGVVLTTLHPMGSIEDYLYVIEDAGIDTLVYDADLYEPVAAKQLKAARAAIEATSLPWGTGRGGAATSSSRQYAQFAPKPLATKTAPAEPQGAVPDRLFGRHNRQAQGHHVHIRNRPITSAMLQQTEWEWPDEIRHSDLRPAQPFGRSGADFGAAASGGWMLVQGSL